MSPHDAKILTHGIVGRRKDRFKKIPVTSGGGIISVRKRNGEWESGKEKAESGKGNGKAEKGTGNGKSKRGMGNEIYFLPLLRFFSPNFNFFIRSKT